MNADRTPEILTIPYELRHLGLQATWELAAILQHVITLCPLRHDGDQTPLVVRGMALRAAELTSVLMSLLDDELSKDDSGIRRLTSQVLGDAAVEDEGATAKARASHD